MTENRPSLTRQHTRQSGSNRAAVLDQGLRLHIDGESFDVRLGDVPASLVRELRGHVGMGVVDLLEQIADHPDIDLVSAFVWLARRIRGEAARFEDVEITYAQVLSDDFAAEAPGAEKVEVDITDPEG